MAGHIMEAKFLYKNLVTWVCTICGNNVSYPLPGFGEPSSDGTSVPADCIDRLPRCIGDDDRLITNYAFRRRLNDYEKAAAEIAMAKLYDSQATQEERQLAAMLSANFRDLASAKFVDLNDPLVSQGLMGYEAIGLIGPGRANEIINTPVSESERYTGPV